MKIKRILAWVSIGLAALAVLLFLFYIAASYYFFEIPKNVAQDALDSVKLESSLEEALRGDSKFILNLNKGHGIQTIHFITTKRPSDNSRPAFEKNCATIHTDHLEKFSGVKKDLQNCNTMTATFMPVYMYRCTVYIQYDGDLKVVGKSPLFCWD